MPIHFSNKNPAFTLLLKTCTLIICFTLRTLDNFQEKIVEPEVIQEDRLCNFFYFARYLIYEKAITELHVYTLHVHIFLIQ